MKKIRLIIFTVIILLFTAFVTWVIHGNSNIQITEYSITQSSIPEAFDGYRVVQISDLHNAEFDENNQKLIDMLKQTNADIIVITGDLIDSRRTNIDAALHFAGEAVKIAPTYYVNGNHESRNLKNYITLKQGLESLGITLLEDSNTEIYADDDVVSVIGITDPSFPTDSSKQNMESRLSAAIPDNDNYKILLAHRPEFFEQYAGKADLIFSGHAHGGQFVLPFVGGLFAPSQGFFPKYTNGLHSQDDSVMVISRGIGNSLVPFRINNNPEIVIVQLEKSMQEE